MASISVHRHFVLRIHTPFLLSLSRSFRTHVREKKSLSLSLSISYSLERRERKSGRKMEAGRRKFSPAGLPQSLCVRFLFSFFSPCGRKCDRVWIKEWRYGRGGGSGENPLIYWNTGTDEDNLIIPRGNMSETGHRTLKDSTLFMFINT